MRIKELQLRTMKPDQTREHTSIESMMERAGVLRKIAGKTCYTTFGLILRKRIEKAVEMYLVDEYFSEVSISGKKDLLSYIQSMHEYNRTFSASYKDIPLKLFTKEEIEFRKTQYESYWRGKDQNIIGFSVLGEEAVFVNKLMESMMKNLGIPYEEDREGYYYKAQEGHDHFYIGDEEEQNDQSSGETLPKKNLVTVHTPDIRTIDDICAFLGVSPDQVIKTMLYTDGKHQYAVLLEGHKDVNLEAVTRILGIKEDSLRGLDPSGVMELTGAEVGFAGPVDLKVQRIIIDTGIKKDRYYIAGANKTDHHITGISYGRHFSGDFHSIARRAGAKEGWLLGEVRVHPEKIRVQSLKGNFEYHSLIMGYLNIDRLLLALADHFKDDLGFDFPFTITSFQVVAALVDPRSEQACETGEQIYKILRFQGIRVLYDDRKDRMGSKFYDYDLMGIPLRVIVGKEGSFDIKDRKGNVTEANINNIVESIRSKVIE